MSEKKVVAIIDSQGFTVDSKFVARELAVVADGVRLRFEFDTEIEPEKLSKEDGQTVYHLTQYIHGLTVRPRNPCSLKSSQFFNVLRHVSALFSKKDGVLGCNNQHLERCLRDLDIPYITISNAPKLDSKENKPHWICSYHDQRLDKPGVRCALRKSVLLWKFVNGR